MSDLKLAPGGDLDLTAGTPSLVTGVSAIQQQIRIALRLFKGEWFLSPLEGIPYFDSVLQKNVRPSSVASLFRRALMKVPGVLEVLRLDPSLDPSTRKLTLDFEVRVDGTDQPLVFSNFTL